MKEPSSSRSALGYLAAFTLGIICMGAIVFFMRERGVRGALPDSAPAESPEAAPRRSHFQRDPSVPITAPLPRMTRGTVRQIPSFSPAEPEAEMAMEAEIPMEQPSAAPPPARVEVREAVTLIADRPAAVTVAAEGTRISGRVLLKVRPPTERTLPLDPFCAAQHRGQMTTRFFVKGRNDGLADVLVVVTGGLQEQKWPVRKEAVTLRLRGCIYENHVVAVQTGQPLLVANFDRTVHNIDIISQQRNKEENRALLPGQRPVRFEFAKPERFLRFKCDVHPWEFAYVNVIEHPFFAVTDANGNFAIDGLAPGVYKVQAHHRKAGVLEKEIAVEQSRNTGIDFEFKHAAPQTQEI